MPSPPHPSTNILFHIDKCIPRSWKKPPLLSDHHHHHLPPPPPPPPPSRRKERPLDNHISPLIDSIKTLSAQRRLSSAFAAYSLLRLVSYSSHLLHHPISSLLSGAGSVGAAPQGKQLHAHIISLGLLDNPYLISRLTAFYATLGLLADARAVAEGSIIRHVLPWNLLISAYIRNGFWRDAILAYRTMVERGVRVDEFTYSSILRACGEMLDLGLGREIHGLIESSGLYWDLFVWNALVAMYAKCGALDIARKLFDTMPERDVVTWNSMISGYACKGMWEEAFGLLDLMPEGSLVNTVTWNTIIGGNLQRGNHAEALRLFSQMRTSGAEIDTVTLVIGLNTCSRTGSVRLGKGIHGLAVRMHCDGLENVKNALITMYSRCNDTGRGYFLFRMGENRSLVTWNAMIAGFALADRVEEASLLFREMARSGIQPNYVTMVTILSLCARVANLCHGRELHCCITKSGFESYRPLWNSLVDMYTKSGRISVAQRVFDLMTDHDVVSYTSLIAGYGLKGEGITSLKLFNDMIEHGIKPDHITIVAVLSACSHSGFVTQGQMIFQKMVGFYSIVPQLEHYSCMVDLYGRAGLLRKAEEILNRMPLEPSTAMLATLVAACRAHGNKEIGKWAADWLLEMRSDNPSHYVLVANMYAYAGCWQDLAKVRALMREMGIRKSSGCSWLDLWSEFYQFLVGHRFKPHADEIYMLLEGSTGHRGDNGYAGSEEFGFDEEVG